MSDGSETPPVTVTLFLFGKPAWEIDGLEGSPVDLQLLDEVAACGRDLNTRLARAAEIGKKLVERGWEGVALLYDIEFYKDLSLQDAEKELKELGIELDEISIREEEEFDDDSDP